MNKTSVFKKTRSDIFFLLALASVIILSIFFRIYRLDQTFNFFFDVARDYEVSREILASHKITLLGPPTSFGQWSQRETYFGPLHYYLVAISFLFSQANPLSPVILTGSLNLISGIVLFVLVLNIFKSKYLALSVSLLYLLSPLSVSYSRFSWNPNCIPFFTTFSILFFWRFCQKQKNKDFFLSAFFSGLAFQLHYIVLPLILSELFVALIFKQSFKNKLMSIFWAISGFISGISPMLIFELRHNFFLTKSIASQFLTKNTHWSGFSLKSIINYWLSLFGINFGIFENVSLTWFVTILGLSLALLMILFFVAQKRSREKPSKENSLFFLFLGISLFLGIVFASLWGNSSGLKLEDRYLLPIITPFYLILSFVIEKIKKFFPKISTNILFMGLLFVLILMIKKDLLIVSEKLGIDDRRVNYSGVQEITDVIMKDVRENNLQGKFNVANIIDGNSRATYYRFFLNKEGVFPLGVESYPGSEILYVISKKNTEDTMNYPVWEISSFEKKQLADSWPGPFGITVYKFIKQDFKQNAN
jgi:hypothetical protein